jgi:hypothetical protein
MSRDERQNSNEMMAHLMDRISELTEGTNNRLDDIFSHIVNLRDEVYSLRNEVELLKDQGSKSKERAHSPAEDMGKK